MKNSPLLAETALDVEPVLAVALPRPGVRRAAYLGQSLVTLLLTLFGLLLVTFALAHLSPIDPALRLVGDHASASSYADARRMLGLDRPPPVQFAAYVSGVVRGDFGLSWSTGQPVGADLARVVPATIELATCAIVLGATAGLLLGFIATLHPRGLVDGVVRIVSLIGYSTPIFWLGLLMLLLFYARLHWAAGPGRQDVAFQYTIEPRTGFATLDTMLAGDWDALRDVLAHLALPVAVLAFNAMAGISRLTRAAILGQLGQDYVVAARAKGAGRSRVILIHVLPNVIGTLVTVVALAFAGLLEGAVLTETVFAWPGLGRYLTTALFAADVPAILGGTLVIGLSYVLVNLATDVLVAALDPRVRA